MDAPTPRPRADEPQSPLFSLAAPRDEAQLRRSPSDERPPQRGFSPLAAPRDEGAPIEEWMLLATLRQIWGYDSFRPRQREAVEAVLQGRDSLFVFPTGGGKSITYQLPALLKQGTAVVVSPLISLMQDQVQALRALGVPAFTLNSGIEAEEAAKAYRALREGVAKLLYVSPERLLCDDMVERLAGRVSFFAIDEAHCISQWGHDFRPGYRELQQLRARFPGVPLHACTATATDAVKDDIAATLGLQDALLLVGSMDRPNLTYRLIRSRNRMAQIEKVLAAHRGEAGIIYCISKAEVDELAADLQARGHRALPYHAGLSTEQRRLHQERFTREEVDVVVATVAFGMGIDRSNVRFVIHAGMPRSIENYQQEAGRAGRDGLPSECVLFYSGRDMMVWKTIMGPPQSEADQVALDKVSAMYRFCRALQCRHRTLVEYFGQAWHETDCGACDVCLGEHREVEDSLLVAQKLLSCVARVRERFGIRHVAEVLKGGRSEKILTLRHDSLSTYGLLKEYALADIADWLDQLVAGGFLEQEPQFHTLRITPSGWTLLRGTGRVALTQPREPVASGRRGLLRADEGDGPAPDAALFEVLRVLRKRLADERGVPPYVIFNDATLVGLSRSKPLNDVAFRSIKGVGDKKAQDLGPIFIAEIQRYVDAQAAPASEPVEVAW